MLIVGPLSDCVADKLVHEFPRKYLHVLPEVMRFPQSIMEKNLEENVFVEYRRKGAHFECLTVAAVQSVGEKNLHGILDISLGALEHLHQQHIFPVVLLLKFKSVKHVREVKDTRLPSDKMAAKAAKEMYEHVLKVEAEHRHLISGQFSFHYLFHFFFKWKTCDDTQKSSFSFSAVIPAGGNLACICTQVAAAVEQEQNKILWVPNGSIW